MNLYQEKLQEYEAADKAFRMAEETLKRKREELFKYVEENIISKDYTIGYKKMDDGHELYYPILSLPEGYQIHKEEFFCSSIYSEYHEESYPVIYHEYVLVSKTSNLNIYVSEQAAKSNIEYSNSSIKIKIKDKTLIMDYSINYKIKIGDMEFEFSRKFKGDLILNRLTYILQNKYICYSDFDRESYLKYCRRNNNYVRCKNYALSIYPNWKGNLTERLEGLIAKSAIEKIVSDIEDRLKEDISSNDNRKAYYLNEENSLIIVLCDSNRNNDYIVYEDGELILEIPFPIKFISLHYGIINKVYQENLEHNIVPGDIKEEDTFYIRMTKDLDMNNKIRVLDILDKFKDQK